MTWIASARLALVVLAAGLVAGCGQIVNPPGGHPTPAATSPSARRPSPTPSAPPQYVESTRQFDLKMAEGRGLEPREPCGSSGFQDRQYVFRSSPASSGQRWLRDQIWVSSANTFRFAPVYLAPLAPEVHQLVPIGDLHSPAATGSEKPGFVSSILPLGTAF